jgi:DNA-binding HxlR family transcriptional regulator
LEFTSVNLEFPSDSVIVRTVSKRRRYHDRCGVARALNLVGDRWSLLIVRELLLGPKRFLDLQAGLPGVAPDVLTDKLRELAAAALVEPIALPVPSSAGAYALTERGAELEPVILALGRFGSSAPASPADRFGVDSAVIALKTLFDAQRAGALNARYELTLNDQPFHAEVADGGFAVERGPAESPEAMLETDPATLAALLWRGLTLDAALAGGKLRLSGSRRAAVTFLRLFPQDAPVPL